MRVTIVLALLCCGWVDQAAAGDNEDIMAVVNTVLKRKDVDQIKAVLWGNPTWASQDTMMSFVTIVEARDRDRALGHGTYEDVLVHMEYASGLLGYALVKTRWFGKQDDKDVIEERINTVILYKDGSLWKITHWHVSAGQRRAKN